MAELQEQLTLDISAALASAEQLAEAISTAAQAAGPMLGESISEALGNVDTAALSASVTEAVQGADTSITLAPDTSELGSSISEAVASADTTVTVEGDASAVTEEIGTAITGADTTVPLEPDGSQIAPVIEEGIKESDTTVPLQPVLDPSEIAAQGQAAAQSVFEAQVSAAAALGSGLGSTQGIAAEGEAAVGAAEGINALTSATKGLDVANAGLEGSIGGVAGALGPLGGALAGVTAASAAFFTEAVNEETAANRLKFVFGDLADSIEQVNLPASNFNLSFQQIAAGTGASLPGLEQAVSRIGAIGNSAGASAPQIAQVAQQIVAIATYLAVTNPALGTADQIVDQLTNTLQRGGRSASLLGISLPTKELNAAAQASVGVGNEVSQFDKIAAGATIVTNQLGGSLGTAVTAGANEAALALPKLEEKLKETVAAVGAPLIGTITQTLGAIEPVLAGLATAIGRVLEAGTPLIGILGLLLGALEGLISVINAIPLPVLTVAVEAFTAALVIDKVSLFAAGLFTMGTAATADVGAVGLLTGAIDSLLTSLGPLGIAIAGISALSLTSTAAQKSNTSAASEMALAVAGLKSNTDIAKESATQLQQQLADVNAKIAELKARNPTGSPLIPTVVSVNGQTEILNYKDAITALSSEAGTLSTALDKTKASTGDLAGEQAGAKSVAEQYASALQTAVGKLDAVGDALKAVESANASAVSSAIGKLPGVAGVVGDVATAIMQAEQATASGSNAAASAIASEASHAKELRDALAGVAQAQDALNLLRAGPTTEDAAKAELAVAQAYSTTQSAAQRVVDTETALEALRAGPTAANTALAQENVSKAILNQEKATLALSDAQARVDQLSKLSSATDRQKQDAQIALQEAQFGLTDATRARTDAEAAQKKLTDDSLAGSKAITTAEQAHTDAVNALEAAQFAQQDAQAKQTKLFADALPASAAYAAAVQKVADAEDRLVQVQNTAATGSGAAARAKQIDTSTAGILAALGKGFDDTLKLETTFFNNVAAIAAEGGQALVDELLALGPKQGAAEAQALVNATPLVLAGLESKAEKLQAAERGHADEISTTFGEALNASLVRQFQTQLTNEQQFFANVQTIFDEGGRQLANRLLEQGPTQAAALAKAIRDGGPTVVGGLESEIQQVTDAQKALTSETGPLGLSSQALGKSIGDGIAKGISNTQSAIGGAIGGAIQGGLTAAKGTIRAQSPSLLFAEEIGAPIPQGIALGITQAAPSVFASLNDLLAASVEIASGAVAASKIVGSTGVAIPASAQITAAQAGSATQAAVAPQGPAQPAIVNHFNLPPIQDPNALAFAISTRQASQATR